jgi:hypothetical protein
MASYHQSRSVGCGISMLLTFTNEPARQMLDRATSPNAKSASIRQSCFVHERQQSRLFASLNPVVYL